MSTAKNFYAWSTRRYPPDALVNFHHKQWLSRDNFLFILGTGKGQGSQRSILLYCVSNIKGGVGLICYNGVAFVLSAVQLHSSHCFHLPSYKKRNNYRTRRLVCIIQSNSHGHYGSTKPFFKRSAPPFFTLRLVNVVVVKKWRRSCNASLLFFLDGSLKGWQIDTGKLSVTMSHHEGLITDLVYWWEQIIKANLRILSIILIV